MEEGSSSCPRANVTWLRLPAMRMTYYSIVSVSKKRLSEYERKYSVEMLHFRQRRENLDSLEEMTKIHHVLQLALKVSCDGRETVELCKHEWAP